MMYRVGDYVYCENPNVDANINSSNNVNNCNNEPYQIRQIEELVKVTPNGTLVEANMVIFYRRRDLSSHLVNLVDRQAARLKNDENDNKFQEIGKTTATADASVNATNSRTPITSTTNTASSSNDCVSEVAPFQADYATLKPDERYNLKHHELFITKNVEKLPASCIRGKCQVNLFNPGVESYKSYINDDDIFFYRYIYDTQQKSLDYERNGTRVGSEYQAEVPDLLSAEDQLIEMNSPNEYLGEDEKIGSSQDRVALDRAIRMWCPHKCKVSNKEIDFLMLMVQSVGTLGRIIDCSGNSVASGDILSSGIQMSAAAATRDATKQRTLNLLHLHQYDTLKTLMSAVQNNELMVCTDELEGWSTTESCLFEQSLNHYGKDFLKIRREALPWKSLSAVIEYYYQWKITDAYYKRKRLRSSSSNGMEKFTKLKQVFLSAMTKSNPFVINPCDLTNMKSFHCDSCTTRESNCWYKYPITSCLNTFNGSGFTANTSSAAYASALAAASSVMCGLLCDHCYIHWKKYGGLKVNNVVCQHGFLSDVSSYRTGSIHLTDALNGQSVRDQSQRAVLQQCPLCDREFRGRSQISKHLSFNHGYFSNGSGSSGFATALANIMESKCVNSDEDRVRDNFILHTSRRTRLARHACFGTSYTDLLPLRLMWRKRLRANLAQLERELSRRRTELKSIDVKLTQFRRAVAEKTAKTLALKKRITDPQGLAAALEGQPGDYLPERFACLDDDSMTRFFVNLSVISSRRDPLQLNLIPLAIEDPSISLCAPQPVMRASKLSKFTKRHKLQPKPLPTPTIVPSMSTTILQPASMHSIPANVQYHRHVPSGPTDIAMGSNAGAANQKRELIFYVEGTDGIYLVISPLGRFYRRKKQLRLLRKLARYPFQPPFPELVSSGVLDHSFQQNRFAAVTASSPCTPQIATADFSGASVVSSGRAPPQSFHLHEMTPGQEDSMGRSSFQHRPLASHQPQQHRHQLHPIQPRSRPSQQNPRMHRR